MILRLCHLACFVSVWGFLWKCRYVFSMENQVSTPFFETWNVFECTQAFCTYAQECMCFCKGLTAHGGYSQPGLWPPSEVNLRLRGQEFSQEQGMFAHASRHFCSFTELKIVWEGCINMPYHFSRVVERKKEIVLLKTFKPNPVKKKYINFLCIKCI